MAPSLHLVLVHGITEVGPDGSKNQAKTFFSKRFPNAVVDDFDFLDTSLKANIGHGILRQNAKRLCEELLDKRREIEPMNGCLPLVFVGHNLGGSLIKQALIIATGESRYQTIAMSIAAIVFYGTPHRARNLLTWENQVLRLLSISELGLISPLQLLNDLPQELENLCADYSTISRIYEVVNVFEQNGIGSSNTLVVDHESSITDAENGNNIGFQCNHIELWQFKAREQSMEVPCRRIESLIKTISQDIHIQLRLFLRALSNLDPETHQLRFAKAAPGSMDWIGENEAFINWRILPGNGILHICGPPGSGTTVVASHLFRLLWNQECAHKAAITSFAFNEQHMHARTLTSLFLSLSRQLLSNIPSLFRHIAKFCAALVDLKLFTQETLWTLLCSLLMSSFGTPVFCIIHATQECEVSLDDVIQRLKYLSKLSNGSLKIIVTAEDLHHHEHSSHICRGICLANEEPTSSIIRKSVQASVEDLAKVNYVWKFLEKIVEEKLCTMPTTYLLSKQRMDMLRALDLRSTKAAITQRVKDLPCSLEESYDQILKKIQGDQEIWVTSAMRWIVYAIRPLKTSELAVAVALEEFNRLESLTQLKDNISSDIIRDLSQLIHSLINIIDDQVYPIHQSFRVFLVRRDKEKTPAGHSVILSRCLDYLELVGSSRSDQCQMKSSEPEFSLLEYATAYWPEHFKQTNSEPGAVDKVSKFLEKKGNIQAWSKLYLKQREAEQLDHEALETPFQIVCRFGFLELVEPWISQVRSAENATEKLRSALNLAARYGHADIVKVLIREGAGSEIALGLALQGGSFVAMTELLRGHSHVERLNSNGYMPLHLSAARGYADFTSLLLKRTANPDVRASDGSTALHLAAMTGQLAIVKVLVDEKADVTILNGSGYDALKLAAQSGFSEIVGFLIDKGANVNISAPDGNTALHLAVEFGHPITSLVLLKSHKDVNCVNNLGLTPLHLAAKEGDLVILQQLLSAGASSMSTTTNSVKFADDQSSPAEFPIDDDNIPSALQVAAQGGYIDMVKEFLKYKADCHPRDASTALYYSAAGGYNQVVKELLEHGMNQVAKGSDGGTALHIATEMGHLNVIEHLLEQPQFKLAAQDDMGWTPLHRAAKLGNVEIIRYLIVKGASLLLQTVDGETPLHIAAGEGHLLAVKELQRSLDTIQAQDHKGHTAFSLAVVRGHNKIVEELLQEDYDDHISKSDDIYPFHSAVREQHKDIVQLFVDRKWDPNCLNNSGETTLHVAAYGSLQIVELLLAAGAIVDAKDKDGETPLFYAVRGGNAEIVLVFLKAGAFIDAEDNEGVTPLYRASFNGQVKVVKELLAWSRAPDLEVKNGRGWTALHAAYDNEEITKLLLDAGADAHTTNNAGMMPLILAAQHGYEKTFSHLLNVEDLDAAGKILSTAIHSTAEYGRLEMLQLLCKKGANIHAENEDGTTALHIAAFKGQGFVVKWLLENGADVHKKSKKYGTPLIAAAQGTPNTDVTRQLLEKGADVNAIGSRYHTALQAAAWIGDESIIELLLEHNADPNIAGGQFGSALFAAIADNNWDTVKRLLDARADPNARDIDTDTPLQAAAWRGLDGIVKLLLKNGAKVDETGENLGSALSAAIENGDLDCVKVLLDHEADPNLQASGKDAPVQIAARKGRLSILEALVAKGADLKVKGQNNRSILTHAISWNSDAVVEYLLERKDISVDEKDAAGCSPLIVAVRHGSDFIKALLDKNANPDSQDLEGKTPLIHAVILDYQSIVDTLLENKADPTLLDARGRGPLYWACHQRSIETFDTVVEALKEFDCYTSHCELAIHAAVAANRPDFISKLLKNDHTHPNKVGIDGWTPIYTARQYGLGSIQSQLVAAGALENPTSKLCRKWPSRWHPLDKAPCLLLEPDARCVTVGSNPIALDNIYQLRGIARADYPMPGEGVYYFEVKIEKGAENKIIGVGFCEEQTSLDRMVGWDEGSWGYHGDDGKLFCDGAITGYEYGETYNTNDIIGCGVNFDNSSAFYTKNGKIIGRFSPARSLRSKYQLEIGRAFSDIKGKLYPAVSFDTTMAGCRISVRFWDDPDRDFQYKGPYDTLSTLQSPSTSVKEKNNLEVSTEKIEEDLYLENKSRV